MIDSCDKYVLKLTDYLLKLPRDSIIKVSEVLKNKISDGKKIFIAGNGGSFATAMHFAEDLMLGNDLGVKAYHFANFSNLTAIPNDSEFESIFSRQLDRLMDEGDVFIAISCSGNSRNLVNAIDLVNKKGVSIGISGFNGGSLKRKSNYSIYTKTKVGDYEVTEDLHYIVTHIISCILRDEEYTELIKRRGEHRDFS